MQLRYSPILKLISNINQSIQCHTVGVLYIEQWFDKAIEAERAEEIFAETALRTTSGVVGSHQTVGSHQNLEEKITS